MTMTTALNSQVPTIRLHSLNSAAAQQNNLRVMHIIRHAQGYHNINNDYKNPNNLDAELTEFGIQQCKELSKRLKDEKLDVECIISSPMRRALQTAYHSFEHVWKSEEDLNLNQQIQQPKSKDIPFVACENWRETVNYICDVRFSRSRLRKDFPYVDFGNIEHEEDPIWKYYEAKHGSLEEYTRVRESNDDEMLVKRARQAWSTIAERPERSLAVVSHSAFFMHMFTRPELGIVSYEDSDVEALMMNGFENCEMRSVAFEICN
jgi:broad specificity phosphatase PhoE